jgi:hypothetical protein
MNTLKILLASMSILALALITGAAASQVLAADDGMGMVLAVDGSADAVREGKRTKLAPKDRLFVLDTIATGTDSKLQILLDDDTSVTMGPESTLEMREFSNEPDDSRFSSHLAGGRMRIITGETTERNPDGFKLTTRHATVGIRGTVLTVMANDSFTSVNVNNTDKMVLINGTLVPEFHRAVITDGGEPEITPLPSDERERDGELSTAIEGGIHDGSMLADVPAGGVLDFDLKPDIALEPGPTRGVAEGTLSSTIPDNTVSGEFSFIVDIAHGTISEGTIAASVNHTYLEGNFTVDLSGGTGLATSSGFNVGGFSGVIDYAGNGYSDAGSRLWGAANLLSGEKDFDLDYEIKANVNNEPVPVDQGTGAGHITYQ